MPITSASSKIDFRILNFLSFSQKKQEVESMQIAVLEQKRAMAQEQEKMREEYQNFQRQKQEMELELQRQQQEAMDRQMAQMKLMFEEQFKKQQDEIENLRKEKKKESEFTVPTKPVRGKTTNQPAEKSESFKIYSDNSLKSEPTSSSLLEDTKMLLQVCMFFKDSITKKCIFSQFRK